ncbi:hypothetical protein M3Y99_00045800 [Aphelenchoides fujianensis]|nr:hypothetical protein M3Y99_00045800 [Aphelenchoides fujianensis]
MLETLNPKKMLLLIGALLVSTLIILLLEEYVEDSELAPARQILQNGRLITPADKKDQKAQHAVDCPQTETLQLVEECRPCSNFEVNALQSSYCMQTGYYDKFLCGATNKTILTACWKKQLKSFARFNLFFGVSLCWSGIFYALVSWRRKTVESRSYTRLQQFLG